MMLQSIDLQQRVTSSAICSAILVAASHLTIASWKQPDIPNLQNGA